jgi:hypothetical protein
MPSYQSEEAHMSVSGISSTSFMNANSASIQSRQQQIQNQFQSLAQQYQNGSLAAEQTATLPQSPLATPQGPFINGTIASPGNSSSSANGPSSAGPTGTGTVTTPGSSSTTQPSMRQAHGHSHHRRHLGVDGGPENDSDTPNTAPFGQLGQAVQASTSASSQSSAQQAYGSVQQGLQNALNSDLITAQSAALQASSISLTA